VLQAGSFNYYLGGEEKSPYKVNCITCPQKLLDAPPTSLGRLVNVIYEPFLRRRVYGEDSLEIEEVYEHPHLNWLYILLFPCHSLILQLTYPSKMLRLMVLGKLHDNPHFKHR